ncbi:tetratricopeptide repeat protein [Andreprevotia chitinilytica]|uniref:tetratricopeptide repeat protein n=1 Tax=Andreprevotia chitinilytica TaxID=396808 RepID=UPI0012EBD049|nr:tetratricopeptide repeat protein [Andreprevotia chitinilytica]
MPQSDLEALLERARKLVYSQSADALAFARSARELARSLGDAPGEAEALNISAQVLFLFGRYGDAMNEMMTVMDIGNTRDIGIRHGEALQQIARSHYTQGDYDSASDCWFACLELPANLVAEVDRVRAHIGLGQVMFAHEQYEKALAHHRRASELAEECDNVQLTASSLINIAVDLQYLAHFDEACAVLKQALPLARAAEHYEFEAEIYGIMGQIQFARGDLTKARMSLRVALKINRLHTNLWGEANDLFWLGHCSLTEGELDTAHDELLRAMHLAKEMGAQNLVARIHLALSTLYVGLDQPERSIEHLAAYDGLQQQMSEQVSSSRFANMELRLTQ